MRAPKRLSLRLRSILRGGRVEDELDEELQGHLDRQIESYVAAGMRPDDARARARREFGSVALVEDECRDTRGVNLLDDLRRDAGYALRSMRQSPGYTAAAVCSLALGIGANTAIFSLVDVLMLRSLPVARPHELVELGRVTQYGPGGGFSYPIYERVRDENTVLSGAFAISKTPLEASLGDGMPPARGRFVTGNFFELLGVSAAIGRVFAPGDDRLASPEAVQIAVIGHGLWQRQFGGDPSVVGSVLNVDEVPFTIVGVLPPAFEGVQVGRPVDFYLPMASEPRWRRRSWLGNSDFNWLAIVGRLRPATSLDAAQANLQTVFARFIEEFAATIDDPQDQRAVRSHRITVEPARAGLSEMRRQFSKPTRLLAGAVTLVLLIACANVVNLLLARGVARRREIALRLAIGASRARLVRQLLTESVMLGVGGGLVGLVLALWGTRVLAALVSDGDPSISFGVDPDARVLLFTVLVSVGSALVAGLVPALRTARTSGTAAFQGDARAVHVSRTAARWSAALIVAQVALSLLLLIGAALIAATLRNFRTMDAGFDREGVIQMALNSAKANYQGDRLVEYYRQVLERVRVIPGVRAASLSFVTPIAGGGVDLPLSLEGRARDADSMVYVNDVSDGFFETMGTRLALGRDFGPQDGARTLRVAIVNEALARRFFGTSSPIGQRVLLGGRSPIEIIGVAANAKYLSLREEDHPTIYTLATQRADLGGLTLSARTAADPLSFEAAIRRELRTLSASVPVGRAGTLSAQVDRSLLNERLVARLLGTFAALALLLAAIGLYGVLGYAVTRRTSEIGVRLALGASRRAVLRSVLRVSCQLVLVGALIGVPAALALTRLLSTLLYGVTPTNPWILSGTVGCLLLVALLAAWVPAWRASRVDPLVALRHE